MLKQLVNDLLEQPFFFMLGNDKYTKVYTCIKYNDFINTKKENNLQFYTVVAMEGKTIGEGEQV